MKNDNQVSMRTKKILVAPLNWGLGHASRCIPIINQLQKNRFTPVIASDGEALEFLKKEFPRLETLELPTYKISYGKSLKWALLLKIPHIVKTVKRERELINKYVDNNSETAGIISDNRFGCHSKSLPSVYITHQLQVFFGFFSPITTFVHRQIVKKFDECWIPDQENSLFSGTLSKSSTDLGQKYIGILSRFQRKKVQKNIDVLIVLSGPEPNRSQLEMTLRTVFKDTLKELWLIQGIVEKKQLITREKNMVVVNFMLSKQLESVLNSSKIVVCRAGYSSIMDLVFLNKKAVLIPTKHQSEQEYLARNLQKQGIFSFVEEKDIEETMLERAIESKQRLPNTFPLLDKTLFDLF